MKCLKLYDRKLSRTVLRRESGSNPADLARHHRGRVQPRGRYSGTGVAPAGRADGDDGECEQGEKRPVPQPADDGAAADDTG